MANGKMIYTPPATLALTLDEAHYASLADDDAFDLGTGDFALDALVRVDATPADSESWIVAKGAEDLSSASGWHFFYEKANRRLGLRLNDGDASPTVVYSNNTVFEYGAWFWARVAVDRDGSATFFVNGAAAGSGSVTAAAGSLNNAEALKVGGATTTTKRHLGALGLLRLDKGRLLSVAWVADEWERLRWGCQRSAQDFLEVWLFGGDLAGASAEAYALTWNGTGDPEYETGWPSADAPLSYTFEANFNFGHQVEWLDLRDRQRALDGSLVEYGPPGEKRRLALDFPLAGLKQALVLEAMYAGGQATDLYLDENLPKEGSFRPTGPPTRSSRAVGYWDLSLELEEV
jgi:hypothetical protein